MSERILEFIEEDLSTRFAVNQQLLVKVAVIEIIKELMLRYEVMPSQIYVSAEMVPKSPSK